MKNLWDFISSHVKIGILILMTIGHCVWSDEQMNGRQSAGLLGEHSALRPESAQ